MGGVGELAERSRARVAGTASEADSSRLLRGLVRGGFVARGVTYALIGALVLAIALGAGTSGRAADQQGALTTIASAPLGGVALGLIAVGLLAYAIWKLSQGVRGRGLEGGASPDLTKRAANIGGGVAYLALFVLAVRILIGSSGGSSGSPRHAAAGVLGWPGGPAIVGLIGGAIIVGAVAQVYLAVRGSFESDSKTDQMSPEERRLFMALGRIGHCARALVFGLIGYFILRTAITYNPANAVGFSGAITRLHQDAFGPLLVGLVAVGLLRSPAFRCLKPATVGSEGVWPRR